MTPRATAGAGTALPDLSGRVVLVTGSTDGVGRAVAERLGAAGARVLVHGRDRERGEGVAAAIASDGGAADFLQADLADLQEVRRLAEAVEERTERLDVLVNNAGIGTGPRGEARRTSQDGYELRFAVNYLAGFLLTRRLLPLLKASAPARIVNVSSLAQQPLDFDDLMLERGYSGSRAYAQSKLAQVLFTLDLAEELEDGGVTANALHPATYMDTTMVRRAGVSPWSSVGEGADAIVRLAVAPELEGVRGRFFDGERETRAAEQAYDADARRRLRRLSAELTGVGSGA